MIPLHNPGARILIPDGVTGRDAFARITHLGIGAHQDDLEFNALHGILACYGSGTEWFGGVTCTDGAGSSRAGAYAGYSDRQMRDVRAREQETASEIGQFGVMVQLDYPSTVVKDPTDGGLKEDLLQILTATRPKIVYTHNPADKHETHIGVFVATIEALREMPPGERPEAVYGYEAWRGLDWMPDSEKVALDVSANENLAASLNGVFDSQIAGGKRYDLATIGRRRANATFLDSHSSDHAEMLSFAMDLTPLIADEPPDIIEYTLGFVRRFEDDVRQKLARRIAR